MILNNMKNMRTKWIIRLTCAILFCVCLGRPFFCISDMFSFQSKTDMELKYGIYRHKALKLNHFTKLNCFVLFLLFVSFLIEKTRLKIYLNMSLYFYALCV